MFTLTVQGCDEELRVVRFSGQESISSLFEFQVEIASPTLPLDALAGRAALLTIEGLHATRYIHGFVCEAGYIGETSSYTLCELKLVPAIWRLLQRVGCRIFQKLTTPQILAKVLESAGIPRSDFRLDLQATYAPHDYCAQYRESEFEFISRLMEQSGIFYYFEHNEGRHILVMTDRGDFAAAIPGESTLRFAVEDEQERILQFRCYRRARSARIRRHVSPTDFADAFRRQSLPTYFADASRRRVSPRLFSPVSARSEAGVPQCAGLSDVVRATPPRRRWRAASGVSGGPSPP